MVKRLNEDRVPMGEVNTVTPIGTLLPKFRKNLQDLSSIYANIEDITSESTDWTVPMQHAYREAFDKGIHALHDLMECVDYMKELEAEAELNYASDEDWYDDTEV